MLDYFILAPPQIKNMYLEKTLKAVVGDKVLRIRCEATGNPKPDIIWIQEDFGKIPAGKIRLYSLFCVIIEGSSPKLKKLNILLEVA